jgi:hypothetical protein
LGNTQANTLAKERIGNGMNYVDAAKKPIVEKYEIFEIFREKIHALNEQNTTPIRLHIVRAIVAANSFYAVD